ncbi:MAG TPA: SHOCT domain-containing protein [Nocardioidaceae bacterium]|nr:SHOCT domain-containing protein [Nocardioidaceae bacterium]
MSFWDVIWFIFITFALVAYLMVMFAIIGDLFRDRETSGFAKAVWILALIFLPIITSLVYLIARGHDMTERSAREAETMRTQQEAYIRDVAAQTTPADQIAQAKAMLDSGVISQAEYERLKEKALV